MSSCGDGGVFGVEAPANEMGAAPQQFIILFHAHR